MTRGIVVGGDLRHALSPTVWTVSPSMNIFHTVTIQQVLMKQFLSLICVSTLIDSTFSYFISIIRKMLIAIHRMGVIAPDFLLKSTRHY